MDDLELGIRQHKETHLAVQWSKMDARADVMCAMLNSYHRKMNELLRVAKRFWPDAEVRVETEDMQDGSMRLHMRIG